MNSGYLIKNIMWCIIIVMCLVLAFMASGCSTVAGLGKDIQSSAEWTKEKMGGSK